MGTRDDRYDLIRGIAIILIIFIHSMGVMNGAAECGPTGIRLELACIQGIIAMGVHLFILLSGALLLGKEEPAGVFYKKRTLRILPPFLIWSIVLFVLNRFVSGGLHWPDVPEFFKELLGGGVHPTYWFVYMIIGLYLVTPLLRAVCRDHAWLLLGICAAVVLFHLIWPGFSVTGRWFSENVSCLMDYVAGYVIVRDLRKKNWLRPAGIILAAASILSDICFRFFLKQSLPFEITSAWGLFAILTTLPGTIRLSRPFRLLSDMSFGIYLSHCLFISAFVRLAEKVSIPVWADPFLTAGAVLLAELLLMWAAKKMHLDRVLA